MNAKSDTSFALVPVSPRHDGWTPERQRGFIEALADTGCVRAAAVSVGMTEQSAYRLRRRADGGAFGEAWTAALEQGLKRLGSVAVERALTGTVRRTFYHGELIDEQVVHSERLLLWLLEKGDRLLGRGRGLGRGVGQGRPRGAASDWDGLMDRLADVVDPSNPGHRIWQNDARVWLTNFPPPDDFGGFQHKAPGDPDYHRTLTDEERDANAEHRRRNRATGDAAREAWIAGNRPARSKRRR